MANEAGAILITVLGGRLPKGPAPERGARPEPNAPAASTKTLPNHHDVAGSAEADRRKLGPTSRRQERVPNAGGERAEHREIRSAVAVEVGQHRHVPLRRGAPREG